MGSNNTLKKLFTTTKWDAGLVQYAQKISVIHHINKRKEKNHTTLSIDTGKAFDKIQHPFLIKTLKKVQREGSYLKVIKVIYESHIIFNGEKELSP